jgi:hypothetical protein
VTPSIVWGVGVGLVIAAIDTLTLVLTSTTMASQLPVADADLLANVMLYSLIGFRVGKSTGVVRDAAEAGVLAGVLVAAIAVAVTVAIRPTASTMDSTTDMVGVLAQNIAIGGLLAILSGWLGTRAHQDSTASRR